MKKKWPGFLLGPKLYCKHKYLFQGAANPGAGAAAVFVFSANGMADPSTVHGATQPRGFNELGLLYASNYVVKAHIKASFVNLSVASDDTYVVGISLRDTSTTSTSIRDNIEARVSTYKSMGPEDGHTSVSLWAYPANFLGFPKGQNEEDLKGTVTANPINEALFQVFAIGAGSANPGALDMNVEIEYYAIWTRPVLPIAS